MGGACGCGASHEVFVDAPDACSTAATCCICQHEASTSIAAQHSAAEQSEATGEPRDRSGDERPAHDADGCVVCCWLIAGHFFDCGLVELPIEHCHPTGPELCDLVLTEVSEATHARGPPQLG